MIGCANIQRSQKVVDLELNAHYKEEPELAGTHDVLVKVVTQEGTCTAGHKVGDEFVLGTTTPAGFCAAALHSIFPSAIAAFAHACGR